MIVEKQSDTKLSKNPKQQTEPNLPEVFMPRSNLHKPTLLTFINISLLTNVKFKQVLVLLQMFLSGSTKDKLNLNLSVHMC